MAHIIEAGGHQCLLFLEEERPRALLVQPLGAQERDTVDGEWAMIREAVGVPLAMAAFRVDDWEAELAPWPDAALSRRPEVGAGAAATLRLVTDDLLPRLRNEWGPLPVILGGYSLAGLFSLWAATVAGEFEGVAAVSPSVWIDGWQDYIGCHPVLSRQVYLSLGDREEHVRHKAFGRVGDNIRFTAAVLTRQLGADRCVLEWNEGNHFADAPGRTVRGFAWSVRHLLG